MKNILVTGGCGFIGSNFIRHLLDDKTFNGRIINVDKLTYAGNPENLKGLELRFPDRYIFEKADICVITNTSPEFSQINFTSVKKPFVIIDCWRIIKPDILPENIKYIPIGKFYKR